MISIRLLKWSTFSRLENNSTCQITEKDACEQTVWDTQFFYTHKRNKLFQVIGDENVHFQNEEEKIIPRAKSTETNYMPIRLYLIWI